MANSITLTITALSSGVPTDPSLCRVLGYLKDIHGTAMAGEKLVVRHRYNPAIVGTQTLILNEYQEVTSDSRGKVEFDLYRQATVDIELPNRTMDLVRSATVPDAESVDLADLAFPRLESVEWEEEEIAVDAGERFTLDVSGTLSNGETQEDLEGYCTFEIEDETIVQFVSGASFTALKAGSTTISITEVDTDSMEIYQDASGEVIARLDTPDVTLPDPITITVS